MLTRPSARLSTATHVVDQGGRGLRSSPADAKDKVSGVIHTYIDRYIHR